MKKIILTLALIFGLGMVSQVEARSSFGGSFAGGLTGSMVGSALTSRRGGGSGRMRGREFRQNVMDSIGRLNETVERLRERVARLEGRLEAMASRR